MFGADDGCKRQSRIGDAAHSAKLQPRALGTQEQEIGHLRDKARAEHIIM